MKLEAAGRPTVLVATGALRELADQTAHDLGLDDLRVVSVAHPIGGVDADEIRRRADAVVDEVMTKYRRARPTPLPTRATGGSDLRREIDALVVAKDVNHERGMSTRVAHGDPCRLPLAASSNETP